MNANNEDCHTYVEHMRNEHVHIDHALLELQHLLSQTAQDPAGEAPSRLLARLQKLRQELILHFQAEEEGGCLEEARSRVPGLSGEVHALQDEHAGFLTALDGMIAQAQALAKQSSQINHLQAAFSEFQNRLHDHEAEENRVLLLGFGSAAMETLST